MFSCQIIILTAILFVGSSEQNGGNNTEPNYSMDKGEVIQVWVKNVQDPWKDNRLTGGVSDPSVLSFNLTSHELTTEFKGVIARNVTATIFQNPDHVSTLLANRANFSGEFQFHMKTYSEETSAEVLTKIALGCPVNRHLEIMGKKFEDCDTYKNYNYTLSNGQLQNKDSSKVVQYDYKALGCPIQSNTTSAFKPTIHLYDGDELVKEITSNFIVWELQGRNSYSYSHTMKQVGCLRPSQSWTDMVDGENIDIDQAWTQKNFESCFVKSNNTIHNQDLQRPYEVMNSTGGSALTWDDSGIYAFKLRVVDPTTSFCDLTAQFAVIVSDTTPPDHVIPTFVVLSSSCLGIIVGSIAAFYMDKYCFG